jgi:4-diphosphocytidyl-2C-methyl-D-erythritol kinase
MMTGSGSAVFGVFDSRQQAAQAAAALARSREAAESRIHRFDLVTRNAYRSLWLRQLKDHVLENIWPPLSRYSRK